MVDLSAAADESGRLLEQFVLGLAGNTEEQSAEKLADFLAAMPLEVLARLAALQDHAVVPVEITEPIEMAADYEELIGRWPDIYSAMIAAGRVKPE